MTFRTITTEQDLINYTAVHGEPPEWLREQYISPEERLKNVSRVLVSLVEGPAHPHRMDAIRQTALQLHEMIELYTSGELAPLRDDECPF